MLNRKVKLAGLFLIAALFITSVSLGAAEVEEEVVFLHTNDEHGVIENFDRIAWYRQQAEEEYDTVFLVSGGDAFSGNPVVDEYVIDDENLRGKPMVGLMNLAGYNAMVIGNHEFDYGQDILQDRMEQAEFPMVLANFDAEDAPYLEQPEPYAILETDKGFPVAFLGLVQVTEAGIPSTHPGNLDGIEFFDPVDTALEYEFLRDEASIFVGLTHMGHSWDRDLAEAMGSLDLIIGGHSHSVVENPPLVNDVLVAQAGADTNYLGKIVVELGSDGQVLSRRGELIAIDDIAEADPEVTAEIDYYEGQVDEIFSRELAHLDESLSGDMALGSLMTDAALTELDADFAVQNAGGIRVSQLEPEITVGSVFELEPFGNELVIYQMNADDIRSLLQFSYERRSTVDLYVGGLHYEVAVNEIGLVDHINLYYPDGTPLDEDEVYEMVLSSYVADTYEYTARDEGYNTYRRHNDTIIDFVERISEEELARYNDEDRISTTSVPGGEGTEIGRTEVGLSTEGMDRGSVSAGNLKADAVRHVLDIDFGTYPTDQLNSGVDLDSGPVYQEALEFALYGSFAYDNNVTVATVTGENLEKMFHNQNQWYGGPATQVSGMTYEVVMEDGDPVEIRIYVAGERIDPEDEYTVGFNSYVYQFYSEGVDVIDSYTTDRTELEILLDYVEEVEEFGEELAEDRITIIE